MRTSSRIALQLAVSAAFLSVLLWRVDVEKLWDELATADWRWLALAGGFFAASAVLHALRWWLLVRHAGPVPFRGGAMALLATAGVDLVLPLHAGTAALFQILARRYHVERAAVIGTLGAEGVVDGLALMVLALVVGPRLPFHPGVLTATVLVAVLALAVGGVVVLLARHARAQMVLLAPLPVRLRGPVRRQAGHLASGFGALGQPATVLLLVLVTLADWGVAAVGHATVGRGFQLGVAVPTYLLVEVVGNLSSVVPLTQGNVGPYELVIREVLAAAGADGNRAAAFAVGAHAVVLLTTLLTAVVAALALRLRPADLFHRSPTAPLPSSPTHGSR